MARLTREQHEALGSGIDTSSFLGQFNATVAGMYHPTDGAMTGGKHIIAELNRSHSIAQRLINASGCIVGKDDSDADDEFSVDPFGRLFHDVQYSYAGSVNNGPLAVGVNCIWLSFATATPTIAFGANYPGGGATVWTPHDKIGKLTMPGSGSWMPSDFEPWLGYHASPGIGQYRHLLKKRITYTPTGTGQFMWLVPKDLWVIALWLRVKTAFNGSGQTLKIGDAGDDDRLLQTGDHSLTGTDATWTYFDTRPYEYTADTPITYALAGTGMSAGEILVMPEVA